jgi:hypothetical protein
VEGEDIAEKKWSEDEFNSNVHYMNVAQYVEMVRKTLKTLFLYKGIYEVLIGCKPFKDLFRGVHLLDVVKAANKLVARMPHAYVQGFNTASDIKETLSLSLIPINDYD